MGKIRENAHWASGGGQLIPLTRHEIRRLLTDLSRQLAAPAAQLH